MPPPPYGIIWNHLKKGEVVPFLGAGASAGTAADLPTGRELARSLADLAGFPSDDPYDRDDLAKVASYYLEAADRPSLLTSLRDTFDRDYPLGEVHRFLAEIEKPLLIITTNYDDLIEQAFREKSRPFHLVVHPTDRADLAASVLWWKPDEPEPVDYPPNNLPLSVGDTTIIYKMHGSVDRQAKRWDSFVITEEDYVDFLARMTGQSAIPARFMLHLRQSRFLFLGYGLGDWNLRVMLKNLRVTLSPTGAERTEGEDEGQVTAGSLRSWAIQHQPSELEKILWDSRDVNIYDMQLDDFVAKLREHVKREEANGES